MSDPLIFLHFGDTPYLKYVFKSAIKNGNRVILIGDDSNAKYAKLGVEHYLFDSFLGTDQSKQLDLVYKRIGGHDFTEINRAKGNRDWTKFNFQKWIVLEEFCYENRIDSFWTFDSDTIILSNLNSLNTYFDKFDYTVMNDNSQLQGRVNNVKVLAEFNKLVIELFKNHRYLDDLIANDFKKNPTWGFTMMRVFAVLNDLSKFKTVRLRDVIMNSATFDECICFPFQMETKMSNIGRQLKCLYADGKGMIYEKSLSHNGDYLRLITLNLSWVPDYYFDRVYQKISKDSGYKMNLIDFERSFFDKVSFRLKKLMTKVKLDL